MSHTLPGKRTEPDIGLPEEAKAVYARLAVAGKRSSSAFTDTDSCRNQAITLLTR
jgi:hypothetical protein